MPLYQLFSRLVALPHHRDALAHWSLSGGGPSQTGPSMLRLFDETGAPLSRAHHCNVPFIIDHLLRTISLSTPEFYTSNLADRKPNSKLLEAALDLLAALVQGQPELATAVRSWTSESMPSQPAEEADTGEVRSHLPEFIGLSMDMLLLGPTTVRIAAANW